MIQKSKRNSIALVSFNSETTNDALSTAGTPNKCDWVVGPIPTAPTKNSLILLSFPT